MWAYVCVHECVPLFAPRWPLNTTKSCKNFKDLQLRHGLSGDMSHTGTLNIAMQSGFVWLCACGCIHTFFYPCKHDSDYLFTCSSFHLRCVNVCAYLLIGISSSLSSFTIMASWLANSILSLACDHSGHSVTLICTQLKTEGLSSILKNEWEKWSER